MAAVVLKVVVQKKEKANILSRLSAYRTHLDHIIHNNNGKSKEEITENQ